MEFVMNEGIKIELLTVTHYRLVGLVPERTTFSTAHSRTSFLRKGLLANLNRGGGKPRRYALKNLNLA